MSPGLAAARSAVALPLAKTGEAAKAGPAGLAVILLLCIVSYFLFKSMSKHMRNVRDNFPVDESEPQTPQRPQRPQRPVRPQRPRAQLPAGDQQPAPNDGEQPGADPAGPDPTVTG